MFGHRLAWRGQHRGKVDEVMRGQQGQVQSPIADHHGAIRRAKKLNMNSKALKPAPPRVVQHMILGRRRAEVRPSP